MKRTIEYAELGFAVISIVLLTGGPMPLLLSGGVSQGDGKVGLTSSPFIQVMFLVIYALTAVLLANSWKDIIKLTVREKFVLLLLSLAALSAIWSTVPFITFRRAIALAGTALFGIYLGTRYTHKQQLQLLGWAFGIAIGLSLLFTLLLPAYGIMHGPLHAGLWRGIYQHKNHLGRTMGLSAIVFLLLATGVKQSCWPAVLGFVFSIGLLILSTSKGALLSSSIAFIFLALYWTRQRFYPAIVSALAAAGILSGYLFLQIAANVYAPIVLSNWVTGTVQQTPFEFDPENPLTGRISLWRELATMVQRRPFLGYGYKCFWRGWDGPSREIWRTQTWEPAHAHNGLIELWLDLGFIGIAIFLLGFLCNFLWKLFPLKSSGNLKQLWPLAFLLYFILINLIESNLLEYNNIFLALYVSIVFSFLASRKATGRYRPMSPPKIVHVVLSLHAGGLETLIGNLVKSPVMAGIPMIVCCLDERGVLANEVEGAGGRVVVLKRNPGWDLGLIFRLSGLFRKEGITVVHTHSLDPMFYAGAGGWLAGVPVRIHTQHNIRLATSGWRDRLKFFLASRLFTAVIAVSEETRQELLAYRIPTVCRKVILNGIDIDRFAAPRRMTAQAPSGTAQRAPENWVIGTVARLSPEKGVHRLLEAFAGVHASHEQAQLLVIGDGPERPGLEKQAERLGIRSAVTFLGYRERIEQLLPKLDLFVLPSLTEGLPLALLEAMACRIAVVATAVGGVPEVVVHQDSGILVPPDNADALRQAIVELMTNLPERCRMAVNGEQRIRERFGLSAMAHAYRRLYCEELPERFCKRVIKRYLLRAFPGRWMLWHGRPDRLEVALTFDDGPDPVYTPRILNTLKQYEAKVTFFVIGQKAEKDKELVERILREGHEIGNHSYTHPDFSHLSWREAMQEIIRTQSVIKGFQRRPCRLFRPPWGKLGPLSIIAAWRQRLTLVMWSVDLKDFRAKHPDEITAAITTQPIHPGDIVLYHGHNPAALDALPLVLEAALRGGCKVVPVSQMLEQ